VTISETASITQRPSTILQKLACSHPTTGTDHPRQFGDL
jgi:hypothetical protein